MSLAAFVVTSFVSSRFRSHEHLCNVHNLADPNSSSSTSAALGTTVPLAAIVASCALWRRAFTSHKISDGCWKADAQTRQKLHEDATGQQRHYHQRDHLDRIVLGISAQVPPGAPQHTKNLLNESLSWSPPISAGAAVVLAATTKEAPDIRLRRAVSPVSTACTEHASKHRRRPSS